ncbi:MAG: hypothetical protein H6811_06345 [Phycisphaeraceae bacterium]|nr:hypothetical protein [Phycisphaeraceae bacterium]
MPGLSFVERFMNLPGPAKVGVAVLAGGGLIGALVVLGRPEFVFFVVIGLAIAAAVLIGFRKLLKWRDKKKAKPFEQKIYENASAAPTGASDAGAKARMDDLRRKFEEGVARFRDHGKDLYSLPWYLLVGEPGSGKTEAVRHCNVGFPPGLQDEMQGAGGTINMNWWFTNHAVILDTAGKLMFENVDGTKTSEWKEFLRQLRAARPNCPINGMLLVIPADSLLTDSADQIQRKGGKIAEQLDFVQKALGVRFPVFVCITKADKINGFREFFENLTDPQLQGQMMGWSNPTDLDEPFKPERVEEHLKSVAERLRRRRLGLMIDPVHTQDPMGGRRLDEVDALYDFPDALLKIAPRLRRYLEMVFVAGEWSSKPLFLRGIYFTSSMQEGAELDADLAEAMGVDVESLPAGKVWEKSSAYFLRDLFMNKVFRESGLVTAAGNTRQLQQRRRMILLGTAIASVLILMAVSWFAASSLSSSIGDRTRFWQQVASHLDGGELKVPLFELDQRDSYYLGDDPIEEIRGESSASKRATLPVATGALIESGAPRVSWMFRPVAKFSGGDLAARERRAHARVLELSTIEPLVVSASELMASSRPDDEAGALEARALAQLVRIERSRFEDGVAPPDVMALSDFVMTRWVPKATEPAEIEQERETASRQIGRLAEEVSGAYSGGNAPSWPPRSLLTPPPDREDLDPLRVLPSAAQRLANTVRNSPSGEGAILAKLVQLRTSLSAYTQAETSLLAVRFDNVRTRDAFEVKRREWDAQAEAVRVSGEALRDSVSALGDLADLPPSMQVQRAKDELLQAATARIKPVLDEIEAVSGGVSENDEETQRLARVKRILDDAMRAVGDSIDGTTQELAANLTTLGAGVLNRPPGSDTRRVFERRMGMYALATQAVGAEVSPSSAMDLGSALRQFVANAEACTASLAELRGPADAAGEFAKNAHDVSSVAASAGFRRQAHDAIQAAMDAITEEGSIATLVEARASGLRPVQRPGIPLTRLADGGPCEARFHPEAAEVVLGAVSAMATTIEAEDASQRVLDTPGLQASYDDVRDMAVDYVDDYVEYWTTTLDEDMEITLGEMPWSDAHEALGALNVRSQNTDLRRLEETRGEALKKVTGDLRSESVSRAITRSDAVARSLGDFVDAVRPVQRKWDALGADPVRARASVLAMTPLEFRQDYLEEGEVYCGDLSEAPVPYWSNVVDGMLESLARSGEGEAERALRSLRALGKFPLSLDEAGDLSDEEVLTARSSVRTLRLAASRGSTAPTNPGGGTIGDGESLPGLSAVNDKLRRLRGEASITPAQRTLFEKLTAALDALTGRQDEAKWITWEFRPLSERNFDDQFGRVAGRFSYSRVTLAGRAAINLENVGGQSDAAARGLPLFSSSGLEVMFFTTAQDRADGRGVRATIPSRWTVLFPLLNGQAQRLERDGVPTDEWAVPVSFQHEGASLTYWIAVKFSTPLPKPNDWPRRADWSQAG